MGSCVSTNHCQLFLESWYHCRGQNAAITEVDNPLSDVKKSLRQLHDIDTDMTPDGVTSESLNDVNNKVITTAPMITDDDILRSVTTNQQEQSDEDDENDEKVEEAAPERPLRFQVESADVIRNAAMYSSHGEETSLVIIKFEKFELVIEDRIAFKKQIFVTFSNPFDCNVVTAKLLKFFKETVKTLCNVSVNF